MNTFFSVIVTVYKIEEYLPKCIDSILNQTYRNFELLLIDDGSPDRCPFICDDYSKKDNRIKVIHKTNGGLVTARNVGINESTGEYICYVDGDDWIKPDLLEKAADVIEKHNPDIVVYNLEKLFKDYIEPIEFYVEPGLYKKDRLEKEIYPYMMYDPAKPFCKGTVFPAACNKIYRKSLLDLHHCEDTRIKMGEDNAFVFECFLYSDSVYFLNEMMYEYNHLNMTSFQNRYDANRFENNYYLTGYIENRLNEKYEFMPSQINAFKAYWLIMAIFHEVKCKQNYFKSVRHIKECINKYNTVEDIKLEGLPIFAKCILLMLKCRLYYLTMLASTLVCKFRAR